MAEIMLQLAQEVCHMATAEERMEILKMVQGGQISAEEGAKLLAALQENVETRLGPTSAHRTQQPRRLRVRVSDLETGRSKVNIDLPWNLINVGMHMGARFAPQEIDLEEVMQALQAGTEGKIVDVEDTEDNERVEIFVE
jgi:polyhydroxyalkanoate synthesis regulator phasin